ncbi:MAG: hypothetical protein HYS07_07550 [Chlamydiae bacterium]|nr:hypothetical protein [Chlamydiota bacterium]MBI3277593.1 hypothetical protein [Chlamydiota bacterium]
MLWKKGFLVFVFAGILGGLVQADERHFTYSYEADSILPKGHWELEQWVTLKEGKDEGKFHRWDFREEIEYGLTDRLTTALYLNFRDTTVDLKEDGNDSEAFEFRGVSSEWKYMLFSPHLCPIGVLFYFETRYDGEELELEEKLILEHIFFEKWIGVVNVVGEEEWEFEEEETKTEGALEFDLGLSYLINGHWSVGVEARNHREYPEFEEEEHSAWFVGPNIHYGSSKWWATFTVLPQVTDVLDEHEEVEVRFIAGVLF